MAAELSIRDGPSPALEVETSVPLAPSPPTQPHRPSPMAWPGLAHFGALSTLFPPELCPPLPKRQQDHHDSRQFLSIFLILFFAPEPLSYRQY